MQCFDSSIAPGATTHSCRRGLVLLTGWLGLLTACGGGGGAGGGGPGNPPPPPIPQPVTQTIGVAGGTVVGPNNVMLLIPPGALQTDTPLTIAVDSSGVPAQPLPLEANTVGAVYSLTPHGTTFGVPVTLSIPFDPSAFPTGVTPVVFKTNERGDGWQQLVAEVDGNTLTVAATSSSQVRAIIGVDAGSHAPWSSSTNPMIKRASKPASPSFGWQRRSRSARRVSSGFATVCACRERPTRKSCSRTCVSPTTTLSRWCESVSARSGTLFRDSRAARLLITPRAPVIVNQPTDEQVIAGQSASFTAASTSSIAQTLQWSRCAAELHRPRR